MLARIAVRSCENVRAKQLGEYAILNKDAPCFDIIFQQGHWPFFCLYEKNIFSAKSRDFVF